MQLDLVRDFRFNHEPLGIRESVGPLIGRQGLLDRLASRIARSNGGSFLLVGYRGVGKTSLVNALIEKLRSRVQQGEGGIPAALLIDVSFTVTRPIPPANLLHQIISELRLELIRRRIYRRLVPALRQEFDLAVLRTAATLTRKSDNEAKMEAGLTSNAFSWLPGAKLGITRSQRLALETAFLPYDQCAAEQDAVRLLKALGDLSSFRKGWFESVRMWLGGRPGNGRLRLVFKFDELDKLDESSDESGISAFKEILSNLKTFLTASGATFIFVAGRGLHQVWEEDVGRGDSIYESVFSYFEYVPAIRDVGNQLCDALIAQGSDDSQILQLFHKYLSYRGRGIPRRALRALYEFVHIDPAGHAYLVFDEANLRQFRCLAELEESLEEAERVLVEARGGRRDADRSDRDSLALRYLADWILERGEDPFTTTDIINYCARLNRMIAPQEQVTSRVVDALIRALERAAFVELVSAADPLASVRVEAGSTIATWRVPRRRLIELGRELGNVSASRSDTEARSDRYLIRRLIARGGMSSVYEAVDLLTQRPVAIKKLVNAGDPNVREMLKREWQVMQRISHPSLPHLLDGQFDIADPFVVMELIEGLPLSKILRDQRRLPWTVVIPLARQLLDAVAYLHQQGIVWGDVKPSNILIDGVGRVRILDLGTFGRIGLAEEQQGQIAGTPRYMAPECLLGQPPTERSEVYSIGVLLYQLITGVLPFDGPPAEIIQQIQRSSVRPPSTLADMPQAVEAAILRCLEREPEQRYQTVDELAQELPLGASDEALAELLPAAAAEASAKDAEEDERTMLASAATRMVTRVLNFDRRAYPQLGDGDATVVVASPRPWASDDQPDLPHLTLEVADRLGTRRFSVAATSAGIGRSPDNEIRLTEPKASRYHARLVWSDGRWRVVVLNPINVTSVNDENVANEKLLSAGDTAQIGSSTIKLVGVQ